MRLTDLEPRWYSVEGDERHGVTFECPCCVGTERACRLGVATHPLGANHDPEPDNPRLIPSGEHIWAMSNGEDWNMLSLSPSIDASKCGHWHGYITNGEIVGGV